MNLLAALQPRSISDMQAGKILTRHIYGIVDRNEGDEQRRTVGSLAYLKTIVRDHDVKAAHGAEASPSA